MPEVEKVEEKKTQSGGKGNLRLPYGLCERYGITLPDGATPRQAWDALAGEGISPDDVYKAFQHNKLTPEDGLKDIDEIRNKKRKDGGLPKLSDEEKRIFDITESYQPYAKGQITKREAGTIYKANKEGEIKVLPETIKSLYDQADAYVKFAEERYNRDHLAYERIYNATALIHAGEYEEAQKEIDAWQNDRISRSTKDSPFYKYSDEAEAERKRIDNMKTGEMITSQEPRKVETYYRSKQNYYGKTVLEAKPSGEDGHLVFGYPRWDYDGTGSTKNVSAEINAGYDDGEVFGIDFDQVKRVSGETYKISGILREKGFDFDRETKTWYKGSKPEPKEKNKKKITLYQDGTPFYAYYAEVDGKPHATFTKGGELREMQGNPKEWMDNFVADLKKKGAEYRIDEGWD